MMAKLNHSKFQKNYGLVINYLMSSSFRSPMKQFIDKNCEKFEQKLESKHEHFLLHVEFKNLIDSLLIVLLDQIKINEKDFIEIAKVGLEKKEDKVYFEQVIACENYEWFKNCMIKRNSQLHEQAYKLMYVNTGGLSMTKDSTINKMLKDKEQAEYECALAMSLASDEEKLKLYNKEDDIEKAIRLSQQEAEALPKTENKNTLKNQKKNEDLEESKPQESIKKPENTMFEEEKIKEPEKYVKIIKVKENVTKYTPQYKVSNEDDNFQHQKLISEDDLKEREIVNSSKVSYDNYKTAKVSLDQKQIDLTGIKSKIDSHLDETKKLDKQFELEAARLDQEFKMINFQKSKDIKDYRGMLIDLKESKRNKELEKEIGENSVLEQFNKKIMERSLKNK